MEIVLLRAKKPQFIASFNTLNDRIASAKFLRAGWYKHWRNKAIDEAKISLTDSIQWFLFNRQAWKKYRKLKQIIAQNQKFRDITNDKIILRVIEEHKVLFDTIESNPLTLRQREAVASDEDSTLVIAGAGTGKTSTILAKIGLLIGTQQCDPQEILAISFTNKSAEELQDRIQKKLKVDVAVSTFHKLGLQIISQVKLAKPSIASFVADPSEKARHLQKIIDELTQQTAFSHDLLTFIAFYRVSHRSLWEFKDMAEYKGWLNRNRMVSLDGKKLKSLQECKISNWLILNGIPFEYEKKYPVSTKTKDHRQYQPDFYLPDIDTYIEHFGVDKDGIPAPCNCLKNDDGSPDISNYVEGMKWKRALHSKNNTNLIETYSWEDNEGTLLSSLEKKLISRGCKMEPLSDQQVLEALNRKGVVSEFSKLVGTFLTLYKGNAEERTEQLSLLKGATTVRENLFLKLFQNILQEYESINKREDEIDFEDMINEAIDLVTQGKFLSPYRYILIDEFQDISPGRAKLIKALQKANADCSIFAVGDDWQSIYRFAGSDIGAMTHFKEHFGATRAISLDQTFRFDSNTCKISEAFILKNSSQIKKTITSHKEAKQPSVIIYGRKQAEIKYQWCLSQIEKECEAGAEVLILERYKHELPTDVEWRKLESAHPSLLLKKMSIHAAKGLDFDYVLVGLRSTGYGFPTQIIDDDLLSLVLTQPDAYPNGEERRLFYVAITRAKKKVFLDCNTGTEMSIFAKELLAGPEYPVRFFGVNTEDFLCPSCKSGTLVLRGDEKKFYGCSNYPLCSHMEKTCPSCGEGLLISRNKLERHCTNCLFSQRLCPVCKTGHLVERNGGAFWGCSNFTSSNCRHTEVMKTYPKQLANY